jgi:hypothetical protein
MLNGISKKQRKERTLNGVYSQIHDFFFIIEDYINTLNEEELKGLYELKEDIE